MTLSEKICALCAVSAPSGSEEAAAETIRAVMQPYCDELWTDAMGNLAAVRRCGKENAKKLLLTAHMDEIGLIVTGYEGGFLRFSQLGGVDPRMLPGREVKILAPEAPLFGVIDTMPPHVLSKSDMDKTIETESLTIDTGLSPEEAEKKIPLGTPVVFAGGCEAFGEDILCGKSLDDRSGVAIIIQAFEETQGETLDYDLYALFTVQEELGLRGAKSGAFAIDPALCMAVDVTHAHTPDAKISQCMKMGEGTAIGVGPNLHRAFTEKLLRLAKENALPHQIEVLSGNSGTDAWAIQVSRSGVATALLSLPIKYMHSPVELMKLSDAAAIVSLMTAFLRKAGEDL